MVVPKGAEAFPQTHAAPLIQKQIIVPFPWATTFHLGWTRAIIQEKGVVPGALFHFFDNASPSFNGICQNLHHRFKGSGLTALHVGSSHEVSKQPSHVIVFIFHGK